MASRWSSEEAGEGLLGSTLFKSLALGVLSQALREPGKHRILDLGPPVGDNVRYFSRFRCRLYIDDLMAAAGPAVSPGAVARFEGAGDFAVVLLWDILDHVSPEAATGIAGRLVEVCGAGSLLYLLVATGGPIPGRPGRFRIFDDSHVSYEPAEDGSRPAPGHTPLGLERLLPGFRMRHSFLAGNGLQEYLFTSR